MSTSLLLYPLIYANHKPNSLYLNIFIDAKTEQATIEEYVTTGIQLYYVTLYLLGY